MIFLGYSGEVKKLQTQSGLWNRGWEHWGRYGSWSMFVLDPITITPISEVVDMYAGDGMNWSWILKWS